MEINVAFHREIDRWRQEPFVWGTNDCCIGCANVVRNLTGVDYGAKWRGQYHTALGAYRIIKREGGIEAILLSTGLKKVHTTTAPRGAIATYVSQKGALSVGILLGENALFSGGITIPRHYLCDTYTF